MIYLRILNNQIEYPFYIRTLKLENPQVSFPSEISELMLAEYGIFPVTYVKKPDATLTQDPVEQEPQQINGAWTQVWAMVDVSPEEALFRQQQADNEATAAEIKADTFIHNFIAMTPAQVTNYVNSNTANLAQVRALLVKMSLMLLALAKREYR